LTDLGKQQAQALAATHWMQTTRFCRVYASDLSRAHETAVVATEGRYNIILDVRLRERAYGARTGLPKKLSDMQALAIRNCDSTTPIPLLESERDVWIRARLFLLDLIRKVRVEQQEDEQFNSRRNVLIVSHAGFMRAVLQNMAADHDTHANVEYDRGSRGEAPKLRIPNASVSIVEMRLPSEIVDDNFNFAFDNDTNTQLVELGSIKHLEQFCGTATSQTDARGNALVAGVFERSS
jgi:broad specificity phosphatase PhoE